MGVIAMQRLAGTIAFAALIAACSAPPPSPSDSPPSPPSESVVLTPPDPALLAHVIRQTEAAVNIAADQRQFLARARGNRLRAIMERLSFEVPLKAAEAAHDSAPAATESAYQLASPPTMRRSPHDSTSTTGNVENYRGNKTTRTQHSQRPTRGWRTSSRKTGRHSESVP